MDQLRAEGGLQNAFSSVRRLVASKDARLRAVGFLYSAVIFSDEGRVNHALTSLEKVEELVPNDDLLAYDTRCERVAIMLMNDCKPELGMALDLQTIPMQTNDPVAIRSSILTMEVLTALGRNEEALAAGRWALAAGNRAFSDDGPWWFDRDGLLTKLRGLESGTAKVPDDADSSFAEAERQRRSKAFDRARPLYSHALELDPSTTIESACRYWIGRCMLEEGNWEKAEEWWVGQLKDELFPSVRWRAACNLALARIAIERRFDAAAARLHVDEGLSILLEEAALPDKARSIVHDLHMLSGLLHVVGQNREASLAAFQSAQGYASPSPQSPGVSPDWEPIPSPGQVIAERISSGQEFIPAHVLGRNQRVALMLLLGELNFTAREYDRAVDLFTRIAGGEARPTPDQKEFAQFRLIDCHHWLSEFDRAHTLRQAFLKANPKPSLVRSEVLLREAVHLFSRVDDKDAALAIFGELARDYPRLEVAQTARWYAGLIHFWGEDWEAARREWIALNRHYPANGWRSIIETEYLPQILDNLTEAVDP